MRKYFNRLFRELQIEFIKPFYKNLPLIESIVAIIIIGRAMAESIEIFPWAVNHLIVKAARGWAYSISPIINNIYGSLGYPFCPDVTLIYKSPLENPIYPLCVWMPALWSFSIIYTFAYWLIFTFLTYQIGKFLGSTSSYIRLLVWMGIAQIPLINWWFYVGCEMMYEIVRQEMYLSLLPPYVKSLVKTKVSTPWGALPDFIPIEGFWIGYGIGLGFLLLTAALIYGFVRRELKLNGFKTLITILPWLFYLSFLFVGSLNINDITAMLNRYVKEGRAWKWGG